MPQIPQIRTPFGGMNQDDSMVTPSMDAAGKNMFEIGDYRYALNARIGSSRSDHFGDLENIKDTIEVTDYYAPQAIFTNTDFEGSLADWLQLDEDPNYIEWAYNDNAARLTLTPDVGPVPEAPEYISKSTKQSAIGTGGVASTVDVPYPVGIQAGDLLVIVGVNLHTGVGTNASVIVLTAGWPDDFNAAYEDNANAYSGNLSIFTRIATGSESGNVQVQGFCDANFTIEAQMYVLRSSSGNPLVVDSVTMNPLGDGAATITFSAVTVSGAHRSLVAIVGGNYSSPPDPTGYTEATDDTTILVFIKEDVSSDGLVTTNGGQITGWATGHMSIFSQGFISTAFISEVLYQTTASPIAGATIDVQFGVTLSAPISNGEVSVVWMNGAAIISEVVVKSGTIGTFLYNEPMVAPALATGIGIRVSGEILVVTTLDLNYLNPFGTILSVGSRPAGAEKVIGRLEDYETQRLYYCTYNVNGNHCVRYWDAINNRVVELIQWTGFNWLSTTFVKMAKLDNWLAMTDRRNPPRLLDVDRISGLKAQLGDAEFREFHISFHKWAPTVPAIPRIYYDGSTNNFEQLKDKVYHFAYRYIYEGNLKSRWSPISKGAAVVNLNNTFYANNVITAIEVDIPGSILDDPSDTGTEFNYFDHTDVKFTAAVNRIELAFRDGELELWKLWKRVDVTPSFNRLHYFDGTGLLTPIPQDDFTQPFDTVPFLAGTVEAIDNRFVFADCLDEKPPYKDFEVSDVDSEFGLDEWNDPRTTSFATIAATPRAKLQRFNALSNLTFKDRAIYKFGIQFLYPNGWRTGTYTPEGWVYNLPDIGGQQSGTQHIALEFSIPSILKPPDGAVGYQIMRTNALNMNYYMFGIVNSFTCLVDDPSTITDQLELPDTVKQRIADHFRNVTRISGEDVIKETERVLQEEINANRKKDKKIKRRNRLLRMNRLFEQSSTGVQTHSWMLEKWGKRAPIGPVLQQELRKTKTISALADCSRLYIDLNNWVFGAKETTDVEYPLNKLFYNYTPGDRVRFVGSDTASPTNDQLREYDVPILEFTGKGIIIEKPESLAWISTAAVTSPRNFNIEVYTPIKATEQDHIFYEMGEWYPILYPGQTNREFSKRNFIYATEAGVTLSQYGPFDIYHGMPLYFGDSYGVSKTVYRDDDAGSNTSVINMSMHPDLNRTYDFWDRNNGRPSFAYDDLPVEKFKPTMARFSGKIVEESFVNNINNMREEDQYIYPSEYGRIRDMVNTSNAQVESVGAILLMIGEREAWSVYVNRTTLEDLSGKTQVSISDDVLGSYNTLLGSHGTLNPESVSKSRGRVYWWDAIDGSWIRYGRDGLTEISEYKMRNWFSELSDLMLDLYQTAELPMAVSEFDPFNRELITFQNHSALPATFRTYENYKGATFSEDDTRWKTCHNFTPERMGKMNNQVIMFKDGSVYRYEKGTGYSTFFGVKYDVMWEPVFNDTPADKKAWHALAVVSTDKWSVERVLSEYRGAKTKQETRIPLESFDEREDNYYASMKRDINTPNQPNAIIEGNMMRCKAIQVLMQMDPSINSRLSLLHYAMVETADSPKKP